MNIASNQKFQLWYDTIMECRSSGLTDRQYCLRNGIKSPTFYYWVNKLRDNAFEIPERFTPETKENKQEIVKVSIPNAPTTSTHPPFYETISTDSSSETTAIVMKFSSITLEIKNGAKKETLRDTLLLMRELC